MSLSSTDQSTLADRGSHIQSVTHPIDLIHRGTRVTRLFTHLSDYEYYHLKFPTHSSVALLALTVVSGIYPYPLATYDTCNRFSTKQQGFLAAVQSLIEPTKFYEADKYTQWHLAMKEENDALEKNGTWKLITLPTSTKTLGCKWMCKIKLKSDGSIDDTRTV